MQALRSSFLAPLAVHAAMATWLCWDALRSLGARVVGSASTETWVFLWGHAWMRHALGEGRWPYDTTRLNFPEGGVLWLKDPLGSLLMVPVQAVLGVPAAATLWTWSLFVLAGACTTLLLRQLGAGRLAATLGGLLFAVHPHALGEAFNCNIEALAGFSLPLWLAALVALVRAPSAGRVLGGAVALWVLLMSNQYWALAMVPVSAVALGLLLAERHGGRVRALGAVAAAVAGGVALFAPAGRAIVASMRSGSPLNELPVGQGIELVPPYLIDAVHLFDARAALGGPSVPFLDLVYPGWLALGLALLAPLLLRRAWATLPALGGLAFLLLSLGPALSWQGSLVLRDGAPVYLPWAWLTSLPLLSGMTLPARMAVPAALCIAVGAGLALGSLVRLHRVVGPVSALLLALGASGEMLHAAQLGPPLPTVGVPTPAHAVVLRRAAAPGAVMDLPLNRGSNKLRVALWYQAVHDRPIQASLRFHEPSLAQRNPLVRLLWDLDGPEIDAQAMADTAVAQGLRGAEDLAETGFAYLVLYDAWLRAHGRPADAFVTVLEAAYGPGVAMPDGKATVWPVDDAARAALEAAVATLEAP